VGHNDGRLIAYNAHNGRQLWEFQTGAGANATPTVFEHKGKEYVLLVSAGSSLGGTTHGDSLWLFGLDGKLGPAAAAGQG
jgi:quinohemoprotein ethanol dehydrogenase